jgi:hypothetical protein
LAHDQAHETPEHTRIHPETGALLVRGNALVVLVVQGKRVTVPMDGWFDGEGGDSLHTGRDLWASDLAIRVLRGGPTERDKAVRLTGVTWDGWMDQLFDAPPVRAAHPVALCALCATDVDAPAVVGIDGEGKVASVGCNHPTDHPDATAQRRPAAPTATTSGRTRPSRRG